MVKPTNIPSMLTVLMLVGTAASAQTTGASLERELLADASARASLQADGTGGHDGKFFLASSDGHFRLNLRGQVQFRYNINSRDVESPDEEWTNGFNTRRTKLEFSGDVYERWGYKFVGAFSRSSGEFDLEDAVFTYEFENGVEVQWGQFKLPFMREENVSSKYQLAADRSVMNEVFNQSRSQGVQLAYAGGENFRIKGAFSDGFGSGSTSYYSPAEADYAVTGRVDFKFGEASWKTFDDFTSFREDPTGGLIGAAVHWETFGETGNTTTFGGTAVPDMDMLTYTVDAGFEGGGWNLYGAFVGRTTDTSGAADADDFGALLQGGVFLSEKSELFARWDAVFPDGDRAAGEDFHTITAGLNHYFVAGSHAAKFTADAQWFLDSQAESGDIVGVNEGIGLAPSVEDGQFALRFQMQLLF